LDRQKRSKRSSPVNTGGKFMEKVRKMMEKDHVVVGIDSGSVSINCVVMGEERKIVYESPYRRHLGRVEETVKTVMQDVFERFGKENILSVAFTGNHGKVLSERFGCPYEYETISQVLGAVHIHADVRSIISMGGQDTALMQIRHENGTWDLAYFKGNGPCASGTGSFIDQQAERLATALYKSEKAESDRSIDTVLDAFISLGTKSQRPANVACRCTVFTKSDMIHLQNRGEALEDIIYGLHVGNARNYISTMVSNRVLEGPILFAGGLSLNALQVKAFKDYYPDLIVPDHSTSLGAIGVALQALESGKRADISLGESGTEEGRIFVPTAPKLLLRKTRFNESNEIPVIVAAGKSRAYLGIDIGSTTTKYALVNERREIIHKRYLPTRGKPIEVTQGLLRSLQSAMGKGVEIVGVSTTGSGRYVVGDFLNADLIIDEITAHAAGAVEIDPAVDTIFEIGGQDSKYISLHNGNPLDFDMNKVCAAGTGSFIHELANKYGVNIVGEFEAIALSSRKPVRLAERCTVFMESDLVSYHQKGVAREDLIAGLCYAVVHNYLNRVVGKRKIGKRIMFLGGPSLNRGIVAAFEQVLNREILVPRHREVLGAYGAAIRLRQKMSSGEMGTRFRGLGSAIEDRMNCTEKTCLADPQCHNGCKLKIYDFGGRRSVWGGECGRYELARGGKKQGEDLFQVRQRLWEKHMDGLYEALPEHPLMEVEGRPTVGMQRALYGIHGGILWAHFFDALGCRVVLTPPTNREISTRGVEAVQAESCYPVKVSHGHVEALAGKTRYLFLPTLIDMPTPDATEKGYYCPMVQANSYTVRAAFRLEPARVLSPVIHLKYDPGTLAIEIFEQIKGRLGALKVTGRQVKKALSMGLERQNAFTRELYRTGETVLNDQREDEPIVVVTGRPYNLYDERLNLRLGQNLAKVGIRGVPMDFLNASTQDLSTFRQMYWGLGTQILKTANVVKNLPNVFGLHLTNFGCGADSFIEHFYRFIMNKKPYLILELDEHSATAGVMTRLEAYRNVIENTVRNAEPASAGKSGWAGRREAA
jgi:predicted CoA-substrate-specific enzyme activase